MKPTVIGIGAQKCASSWVHTVMGSHPEISVSTPKEIDFFSYYFDRGYAWYERHFEDCGSSHHAYEASPSYLYDPRAPERVATYFPELKIVALLRDPVERAYSNHLHEVIKGHIGPVDFETGLRNNPGYLDQGRYGAHLARWFAAFPRDQVLVLFAEEISADAEAAISRLYRFVGVDDAFRSPIHHERRNESDRARVPLLRNALRAGGDFLRANGLEAHLARAKAMGPVSRLMRANSVDIRCEIPPMKAETRALLRDFFAADAAHLSTLLGRSDLPWTSLHEAAA
ncbi:sulfotransferase family protein [Celeribacter arenosi]|uniref:Sulfotransferase n=1 Tax=Celeribacter arenosi TaxID=792649 RepID=A0ABP7JRN9_9RHOB